MVITMSEKQLLDLLRIIEGSRKKTFCDYELEHEQDYELERFSDELIETALREGYIKIDEGLICPSTFCLTEKGKELLKLAAM